MKCECCKKEHDGSYASGRFCSSSCARKYVSINYANTKEKKKQKSKKLKGRKLLPETIEKLKIIRHEEGPIQSSRLLNYYNKIKRETPFEELGFDWQRKILLEENNNKCFRCGLGEEWNGSLLKLELHHKDGDRTNKVKENIEMLCPNCHSQTNNYRKRRIDH